MRRLTQAIIRSCTISPFQQANAKSVRAQGHDLHHGLADGRYGLASSGPCFFISRQMRLWLATALSPNRSRLSSAVIRRYPWPGR
jgi:hypothetical protein